MVKMKDLVKELERINEKIDENYEYYRMHSNQKTHYDYCTGGVIIDEKNKIIKIVDDNVTGFAYSGGNTIRDLDLILKTKDGWTIKVDVDEAQGLVGVGAWDYAKKILLQKLKNEDIVECKYEELKNGELAGGGKCTLKDLRWL